MGDISKYKGMTVAELEKRASELNANADEWESGELGESVEHAKVVKESIRNSLDNKGKGVKHDFEKAKELIEGVESD